MKLNWRTWRNSFLFTFSSRAWTTNNISFQSHEPQRQGIPGRIFLLLQGERGDGGWVWYQYIYIYIPYIAYFQQKCNTNLQSEIWTLLKKLRGTQWCDQLPDSFVSKLRFDSLSVSASELRLSDTTTETGKLDEGVIIDRILDIYILYSYRYYYYHYHYVSIYV